MARIVVALFALYVLAGRVHAVPQHYAAPLYCQDPEEDYRMTDVSEPYYRAAESVGGMACSSGETGECEHTKGFQHSVGVTKSVSSGESASLDIGKIFSLQADLGFEYSWSTEDEVATGVTVIWPQPKEGDYICGLQMRAQVIKTKGKVHHYYSDECPTFEDKGFVDFEVEAPYVVKGGANEKANAVASFQACVLSCPDDASNMDCDGVRSALEGNILMCSGSAAKKNKFEEGWCTAHIVQRQRWQGIVNDRGVIGFMFDLQVFDGKGNSIYSELPQEVDETGRFSVKSVLPYTIEIVTTVEDNDFVEICYAGQCFSCDDNDGGTHKCTLGNGDEHGYEGGDREGDFGFECKHTYGVKGGVCTTAPLADLDS